jgi:hypothetical protein
MTRLHKQGEKPGADGRNRRRNKRRCEAYLLAHVPGRSTVAGRWTEGKKNARRRAGWAKGAG